MLDLRFEIFVRKSGKSGSLFGSDKPEYDYYCQCF